MRFVGLRDVGDPVEAARRYGEGGADEVTFLDITASHEARRILLDVVERTAAVLRVPLTVGGGVRETRDVSELLMAGADKVCVNTAAVRNPAFVAEVSGRWGAQALVVAIDAKAIEPGRYHVFTHGGRQDTGIDAIEWAQKVADWGAGEILLTSMDRDGTREGYDLQLTRAVVEAVPIPVIASGGVGTLAHLAEGLREGGADAALAASIFHDAEHTVAEAKAYLARQGLPIRPAPGQVP